MKYLTKLCETGAASMTSFKSNAGRRIPRHLHSVTGENAEIEMYLSKLKKLVPFMPKNRKVSKLEIIQHVIDYICDLQSELETHAEANNINEVATQMQADLDKCDNDDSNKNQQEDNDDDDDVADDMKQSNHLSFYVNNEEQMMITNSSLREGAQQRQPLIDRPAPNTFLPNDSVQATFSTTTTITHNHYDTKHW